MFSGYKPASIEVSVNSILSYIISRRHDCSTPHFILELRRKLFSLHQQNCQTLQEGKKYPASKEFYSLLKIYVEVEYELLYKKPHSRNTEKMVELRIFKLLRVMLYPAIHSKVPDGRFETDVALKRAILEILQGVKPTFLVKNTLISNLANKLHKNLTGKRRKVPSQENQNSVTSDYGSDDSDFDNRPRKRSSEEVVEVPLTIDGATPVLTVEFFDDEDDDSHFLYLQKKVSSPKNKRKYVNNAVIGCSDSEEEQFDKNKQKGVVTLEILDDNDDSDTNYMIYIQKEIESKKNKRRKRKRKESSQNKEIICLDSDEEIEKKDKEPTETDTQQNYDDLQTLTSLSLLTNLANFLIDPHLIFSKEPEDLDSTLGGPLIGESQEVEDGEEMQECCINDSLLEELLSDDDFLLKKRKEFDFEYFLFNDSADKSFDFGEIEQIDSLDAFNADLSTLDSYLHNSDLKFFSSNHETS